MCSAQNRAHCPWRGVGRGRTPPEEVPLDANELSQRVAAVAVDSKALDVTIIDVRGRTSYADYLVVASGTSDRHVRSVAEGVAQTLRQAGTPSLGHEGLREGQWALVDFGAVVLHVFHQFSREVYRLEQMWEDAPMHVCAPAEPAAERRLGA